LLGGEAGGRSSGFFQNQRLMAPSQSWLFKAVRRTST
jgi:hypothetical protein